MAATPDIARFDPFTGAPRLHGTRRIGVRPGTELIHPIAATGSRPLRYEVTGLPVGVAVDDEGILRGTAPEEPGTTELRVRVANDLGAVEETLELVVGDALALTPPMGWNSWNVYGPNVSAEVVTAMADAMVATGLRDLGYQYVNIDDHWHAEGRNPDGTPAANPVTFPDGIAPVADHLHRLGLKLGIYSDAAHLTCGNCFGGHGYEAIDAQAYATWGVDLLKYDYCYAPVRAAAAQERYGTMAAALAGSGRSIVLSVCEWGFRRPWRWAPGLGASYWRTTPDIFDTFTWLPFGVRWIARRNLRLHEHAGPGRWNDPDMLLVGNHGHGHSTGTLPTPNSWPVHLRLWRFKGLTDAQVHTQVTLWAVMAAPLLASHDLRDPDEFDRALLRNPEVLAVDQDPLGVQGRPLRAPLGVWHVAKPLADGGVAVAMTNLTRVPRRSRVALADLGVDAPLEVTDAWRIESLGERSTLEARLPAHGSVLFVCRPPAG